MHNLNETSTSSTFKFPVPRKKVVVETELMREMESRVLAIHELCGLCAWYGSSGAGKSTTAESMTRQDQRGLRSK